MRHEVVRTNPTPYDDAYAPGPIRRATDATLALVHEFLTVHPEYSKLGPETVLQAAETYIDAEAAQMGQDLLAAGVPDDWEKYDDDVEGVRLAEERVPNGWDDAKERV